MTTPDSGATRPGRVVGVALLGLAAVALVLGLVTAIGGADGESAERPPDPPGTTSATDPSTSDTASPSPSTTSSRPPDTTTTKPPAGTSSEPGKPSQTRPPGGDGNGEQAKTVPVRVLNNSKIKGLASSAAEDLKADGWRVVEIGNHPGPNVPATTVYFRPGTEEEATARAIATAFGLEVAPRIDALSDHPAGVIVIVTSDYADTSGGKNEG